MFDDVQIQLGIVCSRLDIVKDNESTCCCRCLKLKERNVIIKDYAFNTDHIVCEFNTECPTPDEGHTLCVAWRRIDDNEGID